MKNRHSDVKRVGKPTKSKKTRAEVIAKDSEALFNKNKNDPQHVRRFGRMKEIKQSLNKQGKSKLYQDLAELACETSASELHQALTELERRGLQYTD